MAIAWDKMVELFLSSPVLDVVRVTMTLRDAVTHVLELPEDEQRLCRIGVHEPMITEIAGRPAALGFLRPHAIRALAAEPGFRVG